MEAHSWTWVALHADQCECGQHRRSGISGRRWRHGTEPASSPTTDDIIRFGDALVITNPGGISVTTADIKEMHNIWTRRDVGFDYAECWAFSQRNQRVPSGLHRHAGQQVDSSCHGQPDCQRYHSRLNGPDLRLCWRFQRFPLSGNLHVTTNSDQGTSVKIYTAGNLILISAKSAPSTRLLAVLCCFQALAKLKLLLTARLALSKINRHAPYICRWDHRCYIKGGQHQQHPDKLGRRG